MPDQPTPPPAAQPGNIVDPYRAYNFKLVIQRVVQGHFTKLEGLRVTIGRTYYAEGGEHQARRVVPGQVEYNPVTLRYGLTDSTELMTWLFATVNGKLERRNVSVAMMNNANSLEVRRWNLLGAWPCEWTGAPLDALGNDIAIESLTLAYDKLEFEGATGAAPVA